MKKKLFTYLLALISFGVFANKTIDNPEYGLNNLNGAITKIEHLDSATVLHFHIDFRPNNWIQVPKSTRLVDLKTGKEYYATKTEGIPFGEKHFLDDTGKIDYQVYFTKVPEEVGLVDFKEGDGSNYWFVYNISLNNKNTSKLPKEMKGNWLKTNGSEICDYAFYNKQAIVNKELWTYKSVKTKKNKYTVVLEKNGNTKTIKAKLNKDGSLEIKDDKNKKETYSLKATNNPNNTPEKNEALETPELKPGTAIYSGVIKDYTPRVGIKTGMLYVNNIFTGEQESHLIKIADDGTFSLELTIACPQFVFSRIFNKSTSMFMAPGKETYHVLSGKKDLFMGDLAQINTDLLKMKDIRLSGINKKTRENILNTKPEDYKAIINKQYTTALKKLDELNKTTFISNKALELKKMSLEYQNLTNILAYDMYSRSAKRNLKPEELDDLPNYKIDKTYFSDITSEVLNSKKSVMAENYSYFINYLSYIDIFSPNTNNPITANNVLTYLLNQNIDIPNEQVEAIKANELLNTPEKQKRQKDFNTKYKTRFNLFYRANTEMLNKIRIEEPNENALLILKNKLKEQGKLSPLDEEMLTAFENISTTEEKEAVKNFQEKHGETLKDFNKKYSEEYRNLATKQYYQAKMDEMKKVLGLDSCLVFDIITLRQNSRQLTNDLIPYTDAKLNYIKKEIANAEVANYLDIANNKTKATIEANKTKTGYNVNKVEKTEGDELFESIIAKFKGKVIYVDFWATWCGPCRSGIKRIAPLKEEMKDKEVVFLYISAPSSPEKTWNNAIPNIKGEHYRVNQDEWNYLKDKFKITGIPHYALVNKKGELVTPKLGHKNNVEIKKILENELTK
ncbi:TlpA family protein disulfide reductase [Wenyingzhuangia sp. IMCC45467]